MPVDEDFVAATVRVKKLNHVSGNEQLLELYALFKQATEGDVTGSRPGMINFKGRAKYDAWSAHKGKSKDDAKRAYIDTVTRLEKS
jgi:diazepam-binding inhibitor (GABA receptor modulating acyl-CoA-binding protein)